LKYNKHFICSQFYDFKFWHVQWDHLYLSSVSPKSKLPSPNNIFFKEPMATKNVALQASMKNTRSLTQRSCQDGTIPKRWVHGMKTISMVKAATVVVVTQTATPSPMQHDLQQKLSYWMDKAQGPTKLSTPPHEVEDYYNSDSSSPSLKQAFQSELKPNPLRPLSCQS